MASTPNQQRQRLKQEYGKFYGALTLLLADYDPMGLVRGGAPHNEYEPEVDAILLRLHEAASPSILGRIIYETFVEYFGSTFAPPDTPPSDRVGLRYETLGERAWTRWKQWKGEAKPG